MSVEINGMKPKHDADIMAIKQCIKALNKSTSRRMLKANLQFLWDRFIIHPYKDLPKRLK